MDNKAYEKYKAQNPVTMPVRRETVESDWEITNAEIIICTVICILIIYAVLKLFKKS